MPKNADMVYCHLVYTLYIPAMAAHNDDDDDSYNSINNHNRL